MELPGLANFKRSALRGIASHTYSSTAERSEAKAPARNGRANRATYALATKEELFELRPSNIKTSPKD
jgi:hypothetical protein